MALAIKIMGCNGLCRRCYENRIRSVGIKVGYDIDAIIAALEQETLNTPANRKSNHVAIHGGEPLLMEFEDLERLSAKIHELYGLVSIQTNGTLITPQIIELFKKYNFLVGISIDGDTAELNYGRWNAKPMPMEEIQKMTNIVLYNLKLCKDAGLKTGVIALLSKYNASKERLPGFIRFLLRLKDEFGVGSVRTNEALIYDEKDKVEEELSVDELGYAFCQIADVCLSNPGTIWFPYRDIVDLLFGFYAEATCIFTECDVFATQSETTIMADGSLGTCLKGGLAVDGIQALIAKRDSIGERYRVLSQVPQEQGGCKDCMYWCMCHGGCPGDAIDDDWRNRTRYCEAWRSLFYHIEKKIKGIIPNFYSSPNFYPVRPTADLVQASLRAEKGSTWRAFARCNIEDLRKQSCSPEKQVSTTGHRDIGHKDLGHKDILHNNKGHKDIPHGNKGHRDLVHNNKPHRDISHGDTAASTDWKGRK